MGAGVAVGKVWAGGRRCYYYKMAPPTVSVNTLQLILIAAFDAAFVSG